MQSGSGKHDASAFEGGGEGRGMRGHGTRSEGPGSPAPCSKESPWTIQKLSSTSLGRRGLGWRGEKISVLGFPPKAKLNSEFIGPRSSSPLQPGYSGSAELCTYAGRCYGAMW